MSDWLWWALLVSFGLLPLPLLFAVIGDWWRHRDTETRRNRQRAIDQQIDEWAKGVARRRFKERFGREL